MAELTPTPLDLPAVDLSPVDLSGDDLSGRRDPLEGPTPEPFAPATWSIAAAASLACGIFLIVPFFAGLAALTLGIIGIRQTNLTNMRGKWLAIAGTILGLINVLGWTGYFWFVSEISGPGRMVAHHFIDDLNAANTAAASRECLASVRADRLDAASNQVKSWGGVKSVAVFYITSENADGTNTGSVRGAVSTPTGQHAFQLHTVDWKISDFSLQ